MKKLFITLLMVFVAGSCMAMSKSKIRKSARFLTDRMAYELDLTIQQYDDCYEINYDFIKAANYIMDDVVYGYRDAIYQYYRLLDDRNDDMRFVLSYYQYSKFIASDYFYRPIYSTGSKWALRIYTIYSNHNFYFFDAPSHFKIYDGGHSRIHFSTGFYTDRYRGFDHYTDHHHIMGSQMFGHNLKNDFGTNLKERNQPIVYNNYKNPNQNNRTMDERYRDVSGNTNSPKINYRNQPQQSTQQSTTRQGTTTTGTRGNRSSSTSTTTQSNTSSSTSTRSSSSSSSRSTGTTTSGRRGGR
ncbi:MAG: hypothetical protein IKN86_08180 [Bacteroidaceae bacterium]|jgi:hypothetical protein|nr:hypothetical protein [Bacteroidaceae bacterium]MBR3547525.1 hypothetical protein [Bacteroidaceae bacterium]MBR4527136.1 hypothetical protein [Bacteroidaceae bacterium]